MPTGSRSVRMPLLCVQTGTPDRRAPRRPAAPRVTAHLRALTRASAPAPCLTCRPGPVPAPPSSAGTGHRPHRDRSVPVPEHPAHRAGHRRLSGGRRPGVTPNTGTGLPPVTSQPVPGPASPRTPGRALLAVPPAAPSRRPPRAPGPGQLASARRQGPRRRPPERRRGPRQPFSPAGSGPGDPLARRNRPSPALARPRLAPPRCQPGPLIPLQVPTGHRACAPSDADPAPAGPLPDQAGDRDPG